MNKKAYIYISLICVLTLAFSCVTTGAASISATWTSGYGSNSARAILVNQYTVDYEFYESQSAGDIYPFGNTNIYVYETTIAVKVGFNTVDGYVNGYTTGQISYSALTPTGFGLYSIDTEYTPFDIQGLYSVDVSTRTPVGNSSNIRAFVNNFYAQYNGATEIGNLKVRFLFSSTATPANVPDPPQYITINVGASQTNSALNASVDPEDQGFCDVIKTAIVNALNDSTMPFDDILQMLTNIRNINSQYFEAITSYLNTTSIWQDAVEDWLSTIYSEVALNATYNQNIAMYAAQLQSLMSTFPQYSSQVLVLLGKLADMSASQQTEAAAIESQYNSLQEQQDNADAVIEAVARPTFSQGQFSGNNLVPQGQRDTFTGFLALITGNSYITTILLIIVTFATAGFVLFGKKG